MQPLAKHVEVHAYRMGHAAKSLHLRRGHVFVGRVLFIRRSRNQHPCYMEKNKFIVCLFFFMPFLKHVCFSNQSLSKREVHSSGWTPCQERKQILPNPLEPHPPYECDTCRVQQSVRVLHTGYTVGMDAIHSSYLASVGVSFILDGKCFPCCRNRYRKVTKSGVNTMNLN